LALLPLLLPSPAQAGCPSTGGCPQPAVTGTELCDEEMALLFELAGQNALGSEGPSIPDLTVGNPSSGSVPATFPCTVLKAIGYTESTWTQFCGSNCGGSGPTIISFDCGYGVTQVTSGMSNGSMGALSFSPARVASEADYNIGTGAGILAIKWLSTPSIGDNQPGVAEDWYYAVWAYNGFAYVNNPNNPNFPSGRPPWNGPGGLSRGSYPYQELVWGYANYPAGDLWIPLPLTYPSSAAIGSSPGDIPDPSPVHADPCGGIIVDDEDPEFSFIQGGAATTDLDSGGWDDGFKYGPPFSADSAYVIGRWQPEIPTTGLYEIDVYVPDSPYAMSTVAAFDVGFHGGHYIGYLDLSNHDDDWVPLYPGQPFKFVEGGTGNVSLSNLTAEDPSDWLAWDAIRWRYTDASGSTGSGGGCSLSNDCSGDLICWDGECTQSCEATGCETGTCEPSTGVCLEGAPEEGDPLPEGVLDTDQDGIPNSIEGPGDDDGDGVPNWWDDDSDGDGIPDEVEGAEDTDGDGIPDFLDGDADGDGIPDEDEAGSDPDDPVDTDGDGIPDYEDEDSDGDGIPDGVEAGDDPSDPQDSDGDGDPDHLDTDSDNDGISDADEIGADPENPLDSDGDGIPDYLDGDSDGDGLPDSWEGGDDSDADGIPDYLDSDSDNDGIPDSEDEDSDGDGVADFFVPAGAAGWDDGGGCSCGQSFSSLAGSVPAGPFSAAVLAALTLAVRRRIDSTAGRR
jgi:hypothetical protein